MEKHGLNANADPAAGRTADESPILAAVSRPAFLGEAPLQGASLNGIAYAALVREREAQRKDAQRVQRAATRTGQSPRAVAPRQHRVAENKRGPHENIAVSLHQAWCSCLAEER
jgi:hypothetical protein